MSHDEDSFNDAELAILAIEIAKDFKELSLKGNVDPDDSFVSKFELEPDIIHPSRSISYSDDPKVPHIDYSPAVHDHDEYDRLTIVSLSANDSLKSIPSIPDKKPVPLNIHQTKYHSYTRIKNDSFSPQSTISIKSPSCDSVRNLFANAYSTTRKSHSSGGKYNYHYPATLQPHNSPIDASHCLSPTNQSAPRMNHHRRKSKSIQNKDRKRSKSRNRSRGPHKFRSDELNRINTKRFYTMRSTKSVMTAPHNDKHREYDQKRSKSQHGRIKKKRKYKSDALHSIRSRLMNRESPKEPAPYFVKRERGRMTRNTLIDLSLEEVDPFFELSSPSSKGSSLYKANSIRFMYCGGDDDGDQVLKRKGNKNENAVLQPSNSMFAMRRNKKRNKAKKRSKSRSRSKVKMKAKSVGLCTNIDDNWQHNDNEYMVELEDGFMFINNDADIV